MAIIALCGNIYGILLCFIPTSLHGISPDFMPEPSVCVSLTQKWLMSQLQPFRWATFTDHGTQNAFTTLGFIFTPGSRDFPSHYSAQKGTFTNTPFNLAWTGNFSYISSFCPLEENLWIYFYSKMCLNVLWLVLYALFITASSLSTKLSAVSQNLLLFIYFLLFLYYFHMGNIYSPFAKLWEHHLSCEAFLGSLGRS